MVAPVRAGRGYVREVPAYLRVLSLHVLDELAPVEHLVAALADAFSSHLAVAIRDAAALLGIGFELRFAGRQ